MQLKRIKSVMEDVMCDLADDLVEGSRSLYSCKCCNGNVNLSSYLDSYHDVSCNGYLALKILEAFEAVEVK